VDTIHRHQAVFVAIDAFPKIFSALLCKHQHLKKVNSPNRSLLRYLMEMKDSVNIGADAAVCASLNSDIQRYVMGSPPSTPHSANAMDDQALKNASASLDQLIHAELQNLSERNLIHVASLVAKQIRSDVNFGPVFVTDILAHCKRQIQVHDR
jgi:hypothetical protein